ncbi:MAG: hypothetical protein M3Y87_37540, partial [Myxococcota bacterium]|nr:hypothetical protein [Myxococcota bacterium]
RCLCAGDGCSAGACTPAQPIEQVSAGISHTCVIQGGHLWCWGGRGVGETGLGFATFASPGEVSPRDDLWDVVDAGGYSTCAVRGTEMWCFGSNNGSQLGLGPRPGNDEPMPVQVPGTTSWSLPGIGRYHSCAIDTSGALWCFGSNSQYSVGDDAPMGEVESPVRITAFTGAVTSVSAGAFQTCAISAGRLSCWGWNAYGELGNGAMPARAMSPTPIGASLGTWAEVAAGEGHTCARTAAGEVYCWGCGTDCDACDFGYIEGGIDCTGVIGIGDAAMTYETTPRQVQDLDAQRLAHWNHSCAIATDGELVCWGPNHRGALGVGDTEPRLVPAAVWPGTRWSDVTVGGEHSCALRETGALYCWGHNEHGQLGTGDMTPRLTPQRICL